MALRNVISQVYSVLWMAVAIPVLSSSSSRCTAFVSSPASFQPIKNYQRDQRRTHRMRKFNLQRNMRSDGTIGTNDDHSFAIENKEKQATKQRGRKRRFVRRTLSNVLLRQRNNINRHTSSEVSATLIDEEVTTTHKKQNKMLLPPPVLHQQSIFVSKSPKTSSDDFIAVDFESLTPKSSGILDIVSLQENSSLSSKEYYNNTASGGTSLDQLNDFFDRFNNLTSDNKNKRQRPINKTRKKKTEQQSTAKHETKPEEKKAFEIIRPFVESKVDNLIRNKWCEEEPTSLLVKVTPRGSSFYNLIRGFQYRADASATFEKIKFNTIQLSSGCIRTNRMTLNALSFVHQSINVTRFPLPFHFIAENCVFTEKDLYESPCIRNGLKRLFLRTLKNIPMYLLTRIGISLNDNDKHNNDQVKQDNIDIDTDDVDIKSIEILRNNKLSCKGYVSDAILHKKWPFEVRTDISIQSKGNIITFSDLEVSLGITSSKPSTPEFFHNPFLVQNSLLFNAVPSFLFGDEFSNSSPTIPVRSSSTMNNIFKFVIPQLNVDMGWGTTISSLQIDGSGKHSGKNNHRENTITINAKVRIQPSSNRVDFGYVQSNDSYLAEIHYDVGKWLAEIGRF